MPFNLNKKPIYSFLYGLIGITVVLLGLLAYYNWMLAVAGVALAAIPFTFIFIFDQREKREIEDVYRNFVLPCKEGRRRSVDGDADWDHPN